MCMPLFLCLRLLVGKAVGKFQMQARPAHRADYEYYAEHYERHAKPLTHIQSHLRLKCHLIILDKLNEKAA